MYLHMLIGFVAVLLVWCTVLVQYYGNQTGTLFDSHCTVLCFFNERMSEILTFVLIIIE